MNHKRYFYLLLLTMSLFTITYAQDSEEEDFDNYVLEDEWKEPAKGHPGFFAGGGLIVHSIQPDLSSINLELTKVGIPEFSKTMIVLGGQGFGTYKNWRIGAYGFGGSQSVTGSISDTLPNASIVGLSRYAIISTSGFGVTTGYRITLPNSFELEPSAWLSIATMHLQLRQSTGNPDWNAIWGEYQNITAPSNMLFRETTIHSHYISMQPGCFIRYYPTMWMAMGLGVQYAIPLQNANEWRFHSEKLKSSHAIDMSSPQFSFQLLFGL